MYISTVDTVLISPKKAFSSGHTFYAWSCRHVIRCFGENACLTTIQFQPNDRYSLRGDIAEIAVTSLCHDPINQRRVEYDKTWQPFVGKSLLCDVMSCCLSRSSTSAENSYYYHKSATCCACWIWQGWWNKVFDPWNFLSSAKRSWICYTLMDFRPPPPC